MSARRRRQEDVFPETEEKSGKGLAVLAVLLAVLTAAAGFLVFRYVKENGLPFHETEYEESADYETGDDGKEEEGRLNIPVLPDYTVSESSPYILIPYPENNDYEIGLVFKDADTNKKLYRTKRIRPGTVVRVDAFGFCRTGSNPILVDVRVYDREEWDEIESIVSLEMTVIKEEL